MIQNKFDWEKDYKAKVSLKSRNHFNSPVLNSNGLPLAKIARPFFEKQEYIRFYMIV